VPFCLYRDFMKVTKKQLEEMIKGAIGELLSEDDGSAMGSSIDSQLEDAIGLMEMISQRLMSFPMDNPKAVSLLPKVIDALEKVDGALGKHVNLQEMSLGQKLPSDKTAMMSMRNLMRVKNDLMSVADELHKSGSVEGTKQAIATLKMVDSLIGTLKKGN
jgi:hypothetical protein